MKDIRFALLRGAMKAAGVDQDYVADLLDRSIYYVSRRFCAHEPWTQEDQYKLMDEFNIPFDQMHRYFPRNGITVKERPARIALRLMREVAP